MLALAGVGLLSVGGYFESEPFALHWPDHRARRYELAAVYWSGDMGMRMGPGQDIVDSLRAHGIPVLSVSSPMLFGRQRDRAFVDLAVARSLEAALERSRAQRIAVVGSSFGADIIGSGLGRVAPDIRKRITSVVLVVPGSDVYFHANPSGIFYRGPAAADPEHTIPLLRGLPVTCIFGADEDDSLCRETVMNGARRVAIDDGHLMLFSRELLAAAVDAAVLHPPEPMR
jgi:type IV secretory pathway VirJ component